MSPAREIRGKRRTILSHANNGRTILVRQMGLRLPSRYRAPFPLPSVKV